MPKWLKLLITVAVVLIIFGGAGSLLTVQSAMKQETKTEKQTVDMEDVTSVAVKAVNEHVIVTKTADTQATVEWTGKKKKGKKNRLSVETNNGQLDVKMAHESFKLFSFDFGIFQENILTVELPEKVFDSVKIENNNGKVEVDGIEVGEADFKVNNGKVSADNVTAQHLKATTDNGKVNLNNVTGDVTGHSSNGKITLTTPDLDRNINLKTNNGRITVNTQKRPTNALLDVHTDNGSISLFDGGDSDILYGDGDYEVKLTTDNGTITVKEY